MKPTRNLIESVASKLTPSFDAARHSVHEALDITADEEKAVGEFARLRDQNHAAERHLSQIHDQIATHAQMAGRATINRLHSESATASADAEKQIIESHEKQLEKLPEAARPPARMLMGALIKHAKFMRGVVRESHNAAMAAHPWNKKAT